MNRRFGKFFLTAGFAFALPLAAQAADKTAVFAGGCFWSMQHAFEGVKGVKDTKAGFSGGTVANPSYNQVEAGGTGQHEAVQITYDPAQTSYEKLLDIYWRNTNPMDAQGQFCDQGEPYRPIVFANGADETKIAQQQKADLAKRFGKPIATEIRPAAPFYPAEDYHQHYADKNPVAYMAYREGCGRPSAMKAVWGDEAGGEAYKK